WLPQVGTRPLKATAVTRTAENVRRCRLQRTPARSVALGEEGLPARGGRPRRPERRNWNGRGTPSRRRPGRIGAADFSRHLALLDRPPRIDWRTTRRLPRTGPINFLRC